MNRLAKLQAVFIGAALLLSALTPAQTSQVGRLRLIPIISDQRLEDIQESPDHTRLLTHDRGYAPRLWEPKSMRLLGVLPHAYSAVEQALLSQSGQMVGTVSDEEAHIWSAKTARSIMSWSLFESKNESYARIAISPDDKTVAVAGSNGTIWVAKAPLFQIVKVTALPGDTAIKDIQFSPDGTQISACAPRNPNILVYNLTTQKQTLLKGPTEGTAWIEVAPDSTQLLATGLDNQAHLFSLPDGKPLGAFTHVIGDKGTAPQTLMAALFVGQNLSEFIVCGPTGTMTIYDRKTLAKKRELLGYSNAIREIRKSPDGLRVATYEDNEFADYDPLKIWDIVTTKEFPFDRAGGPTAGAFSPNGSVFWVGYEDGSIVQHKLADGSFASNTISSVRPINKLRIIPQTGRAAIAPTDSSQSFFSFDSRKVHLDDIYTAGKNDLDYSPNGLFALSPGYYKNDDDEEESAEGCWELSTKKNLLLFFPTTLGTTWLPDSTFLSWTENYVARWNPAVQDDPTTEDTDERFVDTVFEPIERKVRWAKASDDGAYVLVKSIASEEDITDYYTVMDLATGNGRAYFTSQEFVGPDQFILHKDKPVILATYAKLIAYDIQTGKELWSKPLSEETNHHIYYSKYGEYILEINNLSINKYNPQTGEIIETLKLSEGTQFYGIGSYFDKGANLLAVANGRQIAFFHTEKLAGIRTLTRSDLIADAQWLTNKNRFILTDRNDQTTIWDINEILSDENSDRLQPLGSFVLMNQAPEASVEKEAPWLVMDRDGRFDALDPNNVTGASYVLEWDGGLEPIDVSQFKSLFYEPGLFGKLLGYDPEPRREVPNRKAIRLFPEIELTRSESNPNRITITLQDRDNGGVGKTEIYLNNKLISTRDKTGFINLNLEDYKAYFLPASQLPPGQGNILSVISSNQRGDLVSLPISLDVGIPENLAIPQVNIYGLFVGVGDYFGAKKDLSAPPLDAEKLSEAIKASSERLLPGHVHITTLTTDDPNNLPNRQPILDWFAEVAQKATSSDIIIVFFAGHGTSSIGDQKGYFFLTAGADPSDITPAVLGVHTITGEDLQAALGKIPAGKQVVILDTCHSGAAANDIIKDRASGSDYVRAYESIRDSSGTWLLAGAAADQQSYESRSVDHGLLTYSLLEALDRVSPEGLRATPSGELFLDVERWLSYAATRVESLRNEVGIDGIQKPELKRSKNDQSFDLGVTREQFRGEIGLKPPKPIVLMGSFDEDAIDELGLEPALAAALKDEPNYKLWLNVAKHPNVFRITGRYTTDGDKVTLRLFIQQFDSNLDRKNLGEVITIEGVKQDIPGLVQKIRAALARELPARANSAPPPKTLNIQAKAS